MYRYEHVFPSLTGVDGVSFVLQPLQDPCLHEADGSLRTAVVLSVVLFVALATFVSNDEMLHWVLRYAALGVDVEATHGPGHHEASVGVVGFGLGSPSESLRRRISPTTLSNSCARGKISKPRFSVFHTARPCEAANVV